jgi:hypothetical protein
MVVAKEDIKPLTSLNDTKFQMTEDEERELAELLDD